MELIIAMVLFFVLVACWIILPASADNASSHTVASQTTNPARRI